MKRIFALVVCVSLTASAFAQWSTSGSNTIHANTGNVGIGTSSPVNKLHVVSPSNTANAAAVLYGDNYGTFIGVNTNSGSYYALDVQSGSNSVGSGGTSLLRVNANGNIGIGTTTPTEKIEISGYVKSGYASFGHTGYSSSKNYINIGADNHGTLLIGSNIYLNSTNGLASTLKIAQTHGSMSGAGIVIPGNGQSYQGSIMFHTSPPASATADAIFSNVRMIVNEAGNVGIGITTVPTGYKLAVNGAAIATSMKVQLQANWPDFVFLKDYKLPSLTEVKTYIDKNQHLPDMPSADQVHANGLDLGEMNRLLLKKVEELTLYLIDKDEQDKRKDIRLESQQEQLKQQETRIKSLEAALIKSSKIIK